MVSDSPSRSGQLRSCTLLVGVSFLAAFAFLNCGYDASEGRCHYMMAKQLVRHGQLGFDEPQEGVFTVAPNGRTYASHEFGNSIHLLPAACLNVAIEGAGDALGVAEEKIERVTQLTLSFQSGITVAATLAVLFATLVGELRVAPRSAVAGVMILGFATFISTYSRNLFDGVFCMLLLTSATYCLARFFRTGSERFLAAAFALLGMGVITRLSMVLPIVAAGIALAFAGRLSWRALLLATAALLPFAIWQTYYNHLRTGDWLHSPVQMPQYAANNGLDGDLLTGLLGLAFSPGKSIFVYCPCLLLSLVACPRFARRHRALAVYAFVTAALWFLLHAKLRSWYGAFGWGPRHLLTIVPLIALPLLTELDWILRNRVLRAATIAAVFLGLALSTVTAIGHWHHRSCYRFFEEQSLDDSRFVWSLTESQAIDMVGSAINNLGVMLGVAEPTNVTQLSAVNNYAANRINLWWLTIAQGGVPAPVAYGIGAALLAATVVVWRKTLRSVDELEREFHASAC